MATLILFVLFIGVLTLVTKNSSAANASAATHVATVPTAHGLPAASLNNPAAVEAYIQKRITTHLREHGQEMVCRVVADTVALTNKGYVLEPSGSGVLATKTVVNIGTVQIMITVNKTYIVRGKHILEQLSAQKNHAAPVPDDMPPMPEYPDYLN